MSKPASASTDPRTNLIIRSHGFIEDLLDTVRTDPDRVYARFEGIPVTFGELDSKSTALSNWISAQGIVPGDRVGVMLRNSLDSIVVVFALARSGFVWVPMNPQQRGSGLAYLVDHSEPNLIFVEEDLAGFLDDCGASHSVRVVKRTLAEAGDDELSQLMQVMPVVDGPAEANDPKPSLPEMSVNPPEPNDLLALMYTSGTTGPPKGVMVTHQMLRVAAEGALIASAGGNGDVYFVWEPLYHVGGAQVLLLPLLAEIELAFVSRFSASRFWEQTKSAGATHIHYLGGILQMLLKQPESELDRSHGVRIAWGGGCTAETFDEFSRRFGVEMRETYGMTEGSSIATASDGTVGGTIGRPLPWFSVSICDEQGRELPTGERGEIVIDSDIPGTIFAGYYRAPEASAEALREGKLFTRDVGSIDDSGTLHFHGRLTDSLRCRGENVSAWEIEHVVAGHPEIEDVAVIGVSSDLGEEEIKLFVVPAAGAPQDPASLSEWIAPRLAKYQRPRYIEYVTAFEKTPSERIRKHLLSRSTDSAWDREIGGIEVR